MKEGGICCFIKNEEQARSDLKIRFEKLNLFFTAVKKREALEESLNLGNFDQITISIFHL